MNIIMDYSNIIFDVRLIVGIIAAMVGILKPSSKKLFLSLFIFYLATVSYEEVMKNQSLKKNGWRENMPLLTKILLLISFVVMLKRC